jgi:N-acetylglucosamine-6-sulfatase
LAFALAIALPRMAPAADPTGRRPNVMFIIVDDLRYNALGCMGHPFLKTPNIDRIAAEGARFQNFFVPTSLCSPSRGSFLTGQYAHKTGVRRNDDDSVLSHKLITFPLLLQRAGYESGYVGKWHMGKDDTPRPGFDRWVGMKGQGTYANPELNIDGKQVKTQGYVTDILTDYAVEFIKKPHDKPFVLYLAHKAVHSDFTPAERHRSMFADQQVIRSPSAADTLEGKPAFQHQPPRAKDEDPGLKDKVVLNQLRCILAIDEGVGRLFKALEETGQLDNTLVIFTSDNGFLWGEHRLGNKMAAYEESIRIPMLMRYPKLIRAGSTPDQMALNIDIAPTLLDVGGVEIPANMHGRSLVPVLTGQAGDWRKSFLLEYFDPPRARVSGYQGVRSERWKYIAYSELQGADELYDLHADPLEMKNLINDPKATIALEQMKAELARLLRETT